MIISRSWRRRGEGELVVPVPGQTESHPVALVARLLLFLQLSLVAWPSMLVGQQAPAQAKAGVPLRVLVVTGGHSHDASFYALFENQPDLRAVIEPHPTAFTKNLVRDFDVIALYDMVQVAQVPEAQRQKLKQFAESGKGILVIHHALVSYQEWDWYWKELAGGRYLLNDLPGLAKSTYQHDVEMGIRPEGDHPIVRGLAPFRIVDETYGGMQIVPESLVLLRSDDPKAGGPVAWVSPYRKSRVVALQLGHDHQAHRNPHFRDLFRRCLLWAGGR
jgi:type 1 glutamine amidotransferase